MVNLTKAQHQMSDHKNETRLKVFWLLAILSACALICALIALMFPISNLSYGATKLFLAAVLGGTVAGAEVVRTVWRINRCKRKSG